MGAIFSAIKQGQFFWIDGETFKKTTDISYEDTAGFEIYLDPIREAKMSTVNPNTAAAAAVKQGKGPVIDSQAYITDPATRVQTKNPNFGKKVKKTKVQAAGDALTQPQPPKKIATPKKK
jgi:hypothetical protein